MKKILLSVLFILSIIVFSGCNHKDVSVDNQKTNQVPIEQQKFYNQQIPDGSEEVIVTETETVEEIPAQ